VECPLAAACPLASGSCLRNEATARSVQLIGAGLSEVLVRPGQGVVSFPGSGKEVSGCSTDRDLALISLTIEPVDGGVLLRDRSGDQDRGKDHSVGDGVAGLVSEPGEETAESR